MLASRLEDAMTKPITELRLRGAAERAIASGHAVAAILFGSRARGTAARKSDWDVCLVTEEDGRSEEERDSALEAGDAFWDDGRIQRVWVPRTRFEAGVCAASLEEAIAREGKVLAGDGTMAKRARVLPFDAEAVRNDMGRAAQQLGEAINIARTHAREHSDQGKRQATVSLSLRAIAAIEALGRTLCAITGTEHTGTHEVARNGRRIRERRSEPGSPLDGVLMEAVGTRLEALNGGARKLRLAEYGAPGESQEDAAQRLVRALETDIEVRRGLRRRGRPLGRAEGTPTARRAQGSDRT